MGYKWQCVEYARRWLWLTKGLLLPTRIIAARYKGLKHVYRPVMKDQAEAAASTPVPSRITDVSDGRQAMNAEKLKEQKAWASKAIGWQKVPCTFVYQGTTTSPTVDSLIIYPFTLRNMTGHIGVITMVDLERGLVGVADQNRYFTPWVMSTAEWVALNGNVKVDVHPEDSATETSRQLSLQPKDQEKEQEEEEQQEGADIDIRQPEETALDGMKAVKNALDGQGQDVCFSALFRLECVEGRYFIRDPEDECVGWITFPGYENLPQKN